MLTRSWANAQKNDQAIYYNPDFKELLRDQFEVAKL